MATGLLSSNWEIDNFFDTTLSQDMTDSSLEAFLTTVPSADEGTLVIDPDSPTNREIIFYTSKTALKVNIHASGRGYDNTTAINHTAGTRVIMAPIADWFNSLRTLFTTTPQSWTSLGYAPNTVTYNGNRSYTCVFNSVDLSGVLSPGARLRTTRNTAAPTQSTSLNGSTQYYSKSSPAGMTFTDDFTVSAWIKVSSYANGYIASRYNGTSGWLFNLNANGQVQLTIANAGSGNFSQIQSYQSVPLNKWVHVAAQMDASAFTATTTTSYVMIDGVDVPCAVARAGTNPTALVQAGNLEIGSANATGFFPGKIAQVAIYSAKVTQANIRATMSQGLAGTETSLISAYSFNNSINDLNTTNANNLTANGSAVATNADSPFGGQASGSISSTLDYAIIQAVSFSTNTTVTVQVPEGCTIPTSGTVSAVSYSTQKAPYGMPVQRGKWRLSSLVTYNLGANFASANVWVNTNFQLAITVGEWRTGYNGTFGMGGSSSGQQGAFYCLSSTTPTNAVYSQESTTRSFTNASNTATLVSLFRENMTSVSSQVAYVLYAATDASTGTGYWQVRGDQGIVEIFAENAYL